MRLQTLGWSVLSLSLGATCESQTSPAGRTGVFLQAGGAAGAEVTGAAAGGVVVRELIRRLSVELNAAYLDRGPGISSAPFSASVLFDLLPPGRRLMPYLAAGGGVYRASFDLGHARFDPRGPGTARIVEPGSSPNSGVFFWVDGLLPEFYADRLSASITPAPEPSGRVSFTDPALIAGGGLRLWIPPRVEVRADGRAVSVMHSGRRTTLGVFTMQLGVRF